MINQNNVNNGEIFRILPISKDEICSESIYYIIDNVLFIENDTNFRDKLLRTEYAGGYTKKYFFIIQKDNGELDLFKCGYRIYNMIMDVINLYNYDTLIDMLNTNIMLEINKTYVEHGIKNYPNFDQSKVFILTDTNHKYNCEFFQREDYINLIKQYKSFTTNSHLKNNEKMLIKLNNEKLLTNTQKHYLRKIKINKIKTQQYD